MRYLDSTVVFLAGLLLAIPACHTHSHDHDHSEHEPEPESLSYTY